MKYTSMFITASAGYVRRHGKDTKNSRNYARIHKIYDS